MIRLIAAGGGSGGHIYPAVHVVNSLLSRGSIERSEILWICANREQDKRILEYYDIPKKPIPAGKLRRYWSIRTIVDFFLFCTGFFRSIMIIAAHKPKVIFSKGGYVSVPVAAAGWLFRIPVVSHESDILPGLATRMNCRFSGVICIPTEKTAEYIPKRYHKKLRVTGNPVRFLHEQSRNKQDTSHIPKAVNPEVLKWIRSEKEISPIRIFVVGGSLGSHELNSLIWELLPELDMEHAFRIFHSIGEKEQRISPKHPNYHTAAYVHDEYESILKAADIVISRAGAGSLWEQAWMKKAMILVPLSRKQGSRGEQTANARWFAEHDAALTVDTSEEQCTAKLLRHINYLAGSREVREKLGKNAYDMIKNRVGETIADEIDQFLSV